MILGSAQPALHQAKIRQLHVAMTPGVLPPKTMPTPVGLLASYMAPAPNLVTDLRVPQRLPETDRLVVN
jgi:hypothetical protein